MNFTQDKTLASLTRAVEAVQSGESAIEEKVKNMSNESVAEFIGAAAKAHAGGKKEFEFGGEKYPVTISKQVADKVDRAMAKEADEADKDGDEEEIEEAKKEKTPSKEDMAKLVAIDKKANAAWKKGDAASYNDYMDDFAAQYKIAFGKGINEGLSEAVKSFKIVNYSDSVAGRVYKNSPDIKKEEQLIDIIGKVVSKENSKTAASNLLSKDDFLPDAVSTYRQLQKGKVTPDAVSAALKTKGIKESPEEPLSAGEKAFKALHVAVKKDGEEEEEDSVDRMTEAKIFKKGTDVWYTTNDGEDVEAKILSYNKKAKIYLIIWKGNEMEAEPEELSLDESTV